VPKGQIRSGDIFLGYLRDDKIIIKIKWFGKIGQNNREGIKIARISFSFSNPVESVSILHRAALRRGRSKRVDANG